MKDTIRKYEKYEIRAVKISKKNRAILDKFLKICSQTAGPKKLDNIERVMLKIFDVFECDYDELDNDKLIEFLSLLKQAELEKTTKNEFRKFLKRFIREMYPDWVKRFKNLKHPGLRLVNDINQKKINADTILKEEDIDNLIRLSENIKFKTMIILMWETAGRPEEIYNAKWKNFNEHEETLTLTSSKTGNTRTLPLKESVAHLSRYKKEFPYSFVNSEDYIFPAVQNRDKHITENLVTFFFRKLGRIAGKSVYPYLIRHSRLSSLHKKKIPDKVYEKYADHSLKTASRYSHLDKEDIKEIFDEMVYKAEELPEGKKQELEKQINSLQEKLEIEIQERKKETEQRKKAEEGKRKKEEKNKKLAKEIDWDNMVFNRMVENPEEVPKLVKIMVRIFKEQEEKLKGN